MLFVRRPFCLRGQAVNHTRERNRFPDMVQTADPGDATLYAHSKAGVRNRAIFAQVNIPVEGFLRQVVFCEPRVNVSRPTRRDLKCFPARASVFCVVRDFVK